MKEDKLADGSSGVNPLGPSRKIKAAVRKAIKKISESSYLEMDALSRFFQSKFGLSPENVLFANSLKELLYLVPEVLCPGRILIAGPAFQVYADAAHAAGADVSYVHAKEMDGFAFDMSTILEELRNTDLVFLANPNRISGKMLAWGKLRETLAMLPEKGPHFLIDEAMIEFAGPADDHVDQLCLEHCTILRTTAYFYGMPGLELAYAVSSAEAIELYNKKRRWSITPLSAEAARTAYQDSTYRKLSKEYMRAEKQMIVSRLDKVDWIKVYDTDTNTILMKIDKGPDEVERRLRRAGLHIENCGGIKGLDNSFFRVSVMKHENNLKLISALKNM